MTQHASIEGRELMADDRYPGYKATLEAKRKHYEDRLIQEPRRGTDPAVHHAHMTRCAGAIEALDFALGKPELMRDSLPESPTTPSTPH